MVKKYRIELNDEFRRVVEPAGASCQGSLESNFFKKSRSDLFFCSHLAILWLPVKGKQGRPMLFENGSISQKMIRKDDVA